MLILCQGIHVFSRNRERMEKKFLTRRNFIKKTGQVTVGVLCSHPLISHAAFWRKRSLSFYHTHTGEKLNITYARGGIHDPQALEWINNYLRDFRTGDKHPIDPRLLDILWAVKKDMNNKGVFEVISGYRSPWTNDFLRKKSTGVAKQSLHMEGRAIDVRLSGVDTRRLRKCAVNLQGGGVGYYEKSNFVHLDTGSVRTW